MLKRELASIRSSARRSVELSSRLQLESQELKGRIESARYEEERDRNTANDLEEELSELADEVSAQLDELERINGGGGGMGMVVGRAMKSFGDVVSAGGRSRTSSTASIADELEIRLQDALSTAAAASGDGGHPNSDGELDVTFNDDRSLRSSRSAGLEEHRSVSSGRATSRSKRPPSEMQKQWEATYNNVDSRRSTRRGSGSDSKNHKESCGGNTGQDEGSLTSSGDMTFPEPASRSRTVSHSSRRRHYLNESYISKRATTNSVTSSASDVPSSVRNFTESFSGLFRSLGQEVDND